MNFPINKFIKINLKNIKPIFYQNNSKCKCFPIIDDVNGQRWLCEFKKGFILEPHKHEGRYEWYILSGKFKFTNEFGEECILEKDDYYCNPANIIHKDECLEDGRVLWIYDRNFNY